MSADPRRAVPRTDTLLADPALAAAASRLGRDLVKDAVRAVQARVRAGELETKFSMPGEVLCLPLPARSVSQEAFSA